MHGEINLNLVFTKMVEIGHATSKSSFIESIGIFIDSESNMIHKGLVNDKSALV